MEHDPIRDTSLSEDVQLMVRIAAGDGAAFAQFYSRFSGPVLNLARSIVRSAAAAEDIRQEAFQETWKRAGEYRESLGSPFAWIMTIARHKAIDRLRFEVRRLRQSAEYEADLGAAEASSQASADRSILTNEVGVAVRGALGLLGERERQAIELAYFEGLTAGEISQRLHLPLGTVKARVRRGLRHLQRPLASWR